MSPDLVVRYAGHPAVSRIRFAPGGLDRAGAFVRATLDPGRVAVVTDARVSRLYGPRLLRALRRAGIEARVFVVPRGEPAKRARPLARLWDGFAGFELTRDDAVVALGGGVVGDLAGFAAASWLRGVPWIAIPTTVLAQVDASVGGKTAIDLAAGKNLVGAFHQPAGVLIDVDTLATLSERQRRAGLAEVVKTGMAVDADLFRWSERHADALARGEPEALAGAVSRSVRAKSRIVAADEREREGGRRTALNYGHTLGHAIEAARGYRGILHGEAVAIGMRAAAALSEQVAGLPPAARARQDALLDRLGLPRRMPGIPIHALRRAMALDKKRRRAARGRSASRARARRARADVRWVLTVSIGDASVPRTVSDRLVRAVLLQVGARA